MNEDRVTVYAMRAEREREREYSARVCLENVGGRGRDRQVGVATELND